MLPSMHSRTSCLCSADRFCDDLAADQQPRVICCRACAHRHVKLHSIKGNRLTTMHGNAGGELCRCRRAQASALGRVYAPERQENAERRACRHAVQRWMPRMTYQTDRHPFAIHFVSSAQAIMLLAGTACPHSIADINEYNMNAGERCMLKRLSQAGTLPGHRHK